MKDHVIDEKEDYKEIGICGFDYKLFEEEEGGREQEGLDGYPYLKYLIQLWPGDWLRRMEKNETSGLYEESFYTKWGRERVSKTFQKARVLEIYWLYFIGSYLWE